MTLDELYMGKALAEAETAFAVEEIPIGAVIVHENTIIARAYNLRETLPCATAHAELLAIEKACRHLNRWRLSGCTLYVTTEPCPMCAGAIVNSRLDRLVYGCPDPKAGAVHTLFHLTDHPRLNHRVAVTAGIRADECADLLRRFFRLRRKKTRTADAVKIRVPCGRVRVFYGTNPQPVYRTSGLKFLYILPPAKKQPDNRSDCSTCFYFNASYKKATPSCTEAHLPLQHVPEPRIYNLVRNVIGNAPASKSSIPKKNELPILQNPVRIESSYLNQMVTR